MIRVIRMAYTIPGAKIYVNAVQTSFNGVVTACTILTLYLFVSSHIVLRPPISPCNRESN